MNNATNAWLEIAIDLLDLSADADLSTVAVQRRIRRLANIALSYVEADAQKDKVFVEIASEIADTNTRLAIGVLRVVLGTATKEDLNITMGQLVAATDDAKVLNEVVSKIGGG